MAPFFTGADTRPRTLRVDCHKKSLASDSLKELKRLIQTAHEEHEDISSQLATALAEKQKANRRHSSWDKGFLSKKVFKANFAKRQLDSETADAKASTG